MVLDQLKFLANVHVEGNRIPRRLIPKIRMALRVFPDRRPKLFVQYGRLIFVGVFSDWLDTVNWVVEHYDTIEGVSKTSLGTFFEMALRLTMTKNKYWVYVKGYDCDGFAIPSYKDGISVDHAAVFIDGVIALKVVSRDGKYFIADYLIGNMSPRIANQITYLWYDHEKDYNRCI